MIHIEGRNISPYLPGDKHLAHLCQRNRKRYELNTKWREKLSEILEKIIRTPTLWKDEEVTSWFGHDPSVPTDPYPTALLIVRVPKAIASTEHLRLEVGLQLYKAFATFLCAMRDTTSAKVHVDIDVV